MSHPRLTNRAIARVPARCRIGRGATIAVCAGVILSLIWGTSLATAEASEAEGIGLEAAQERLGDCVPTGRGVVMGHVEGGPDRYMPERGGDRFVGVTLKPRAGASETFAHTTRTAGILYGPDGLAPGVRTVHHFPVVDWITDGYLRAGELFPPRPEPIRVWSHSWISEGEPAEADLRAGDEARRLSHVLRRVDHVIDTQETVMCVGVNNGRSSGVPALLASAYNAIAVGAAEGASSGGYTAIDAAGRCKPDVIAPRRRTSYATPVVAACVARLVEAADALAAEVAAERGVDAATIGAARPEVIKAVLMAGAVKPSNWSPEPGRPLDEHLGAGRVHLDHALRILEAGPQSPERQAATTGWSYRALEREQTHDYRFELAEAAPAMSIMLTWHRRIDARVHRHPLTGSPQWQDTPRLAQLDLRLHYTDDDGQSGVIARSISDLDNVQHIHLEQPPPGAYRIEVSRRGDEHDEPWDYAVAWRTGE